MTWTILEWSLFVGVVAALVGVQFGKPASRYDKFAQLSPVLSVGVGCLVYWSILFMTQSSRFLYYQF